MQIVVINRTFKIKQYVHHDISNRLGLTNFLFICLFNFWRWRISVFSYFCCVYDKGDQNYSPKFHDLFFASYRKFGSFCSILQDWRMFQDWSIYTLVAWYVTYLKKNYKLLRRMLNIFVFEMLEDTDIFSHMPFADFLARLPTPCCTLIIHTTFWSTGLKRQLCRLTSILKLICLMSIVYSLKHLSLIVLALT